MLKLYQKKIAITMFSFCSEHDINFTIKDIAIEAGISPATVCRLTKSLRIKRPSYKTNNKKEIRYIINEEGCWIWQLYIDPNGYGTICITSNGKEVTWLAYNWYYFQKFGNIPNNMDLDHLCRNRACVNPDHLEPVTRAVNTQRGELAKLDAAQILEIRKLYSTGLYHQSYLASRFGVTQGLISQIILRKIWKNI